MMSPSLKILSRFWWRVRGECVYTTRMCGEGECCDSAPATYFFSSVTTTSTGTFQHSAPTKDF